MAGTALTRGPRRIAILRFSALGDVLLTTPALEALKEAWPDSERLLVTQAGPARLLQESALLQERLVMRPGESVGQLRGRLLAWRPDAILDLHSSLRSRLLTASLPWIRSVRWKKRDLLDTLRVRLLGLPWRSERLIAERSHEAVERLVGRRLERGRLQFTPTAEALVRAEEQLALLQPGVPRVAMSPGAGWATKRWPVERFGALAARARDRGMEVLLSGSPEELALCEQVRALAPGSRVLDLPLEVWGALIGRCDVLVANDSAPWHLARAQQVKTLAFFGPTEHRQFDLRGHRVLHRPLPCSPCHFYGQRRCPREHWSCMLSIEVEEAWAALCEILEAPPPPELIG